MDKLLEKLKALGIDEAVIAEVKFDYETSVNEKVEAKVSITLEEKSKELEEKFKKDSEEKEAKIKEDLETKNTETMKEMEEGFITQIDEFIDTQVIANIDESILDEFAVNKACAPIVDAFRKIYEETFVELDSDGAAVVAEAKERVETLEREVNEKIAENIELQKESANLRKEKLISESVAGLKEDQKSKVAEFFADKTLEECETKLGTFVEMLVEAAGKPAEKTAETVVLTEGDKLEDPAPKTVVAELTEAQKLGKMAGQYL